jgi:glycosylphosphatidylinositol transamidase (GPIT) subunit GPI8
MTKSQQKRRLNEAMSKLTKVFMSGHGNDYVLSVQDIVALEKIIKKGLNRIK